MPRSKNLLNIAVWMVICVSSAVAQKSDFALKSGDRVVFFGDSITQQRLYTSYVQQFVLSRYPQMDVTFINSGWGGDKVNGNDCVPCAGVGALPRIERDVIAHKPTVVTLLFGMNDGLYKEFDPAVMKIYTDGLSEIIRIIKKESDARIYVMTPTAFDGTRPTPRPRNNQYNDVLDRYSEAAKEIARRENLPVIDLHTATSTALKVAKQAQPDYTFEDDGASRTGWASGYGGRDRASLGRPGSGSGGGAENRTQGWFREVFRCGSAALACACNFRADTASRPTHSTDRCGDVETDRAGAGKLQVQRGWKFRREILCGAIRGGCFFDSAFSAGANRFGGPGEIGAGQRRY
jgi:lysophospholipase L1-like esterase